MSVEAKQLNSLALAYMGDAIYEVFVREYLLNHGQVKPNTLHQTAIEYVAANRQAAVVHHWMTDECLSDQEHAIIKRGRNAKSLSTPKNMSISDYRHATAFESLIGYHYLEKNEDRLQELLYDAVTWIHQIKTKP